MRGLNPKRIPELVAKHVERARRESAFVLEIDDNGEIEWYKSNPNYKLGVIAVIGPGYAFGEYFGEALLLEVGIWRTRPYREAKNQQRANNEPCHLSPRSKWFFLSEQQYLNIVPVIFEIIQQITDKQDATRKCGHQNGNSFIIKIGKYYLARGRRKDHKTGERQPQRTLFYHEKSKELPIGVRFSISQKDISLVQFIYWLEINKNAILKDGAESVAKLINICLAPYNKKGFYRDPKKLKGVQQVNEIICSKPYYWLEEIVEKYLPEREKNPLFNEIRELIGWKDGKAIERRLAESAVVIPDCDVLLRITTGLDAKKDYIVFEVAPSCCFKEKDEVEEVPF